MSARCTSPVTSERAHARISENLTSAARARRRMLRFSFRRRTFVVRSQSAPSARALKHMDAADAQQATYQPVPEAT